MRARLVVAGARHVLRQANGKTASPRIMVEPAPGNTNLAWSSQSALPQRSRTPSESDAEGRREGLRLLPASQHGRLAGAADPSADTSVRDEPHAVHAAMATAAMVKLMRFTPIISNWKLGLRHEHLPLAQP